MPSLPIPPAFSVSCFALSSHGFTSRLAGCHLGHMRIHGMVPKPSGLLYSLVILLPPCSFQNFKICPIMLVGPFGLRQASRLCFNYECLQFPSMIFGGCRGVRFLFIRAPVVCKVPNFRRTSFVVMIFSDRLPKVASKVQAV